jgi:Ca2+-dependent lipid-binding protein
VINGNASSSPEPLADTNFFENGNEKTMLLNESSNMAADDEGQGQMNEINRALNASRANLNKLKDQFTQRARTVMTKAPSLTSILSTPPTTPNTIPEPVYWTEIFIEKGKDLAVKDLNGTSDPYVKVFYGTEEKYTTNTVTKNLNPVWNEKFTIFTENLNIPLYFYIFDHDRIGRDEAMGQAKLDLWKLPFDQLYSATLELEDEKRNDGKFGTLKISITITPKTAEFRDEVANQNFDDDFYLIFVFFKIGSS